jgi:hypothetical protein
MIRDRVARAALRAYPSTVRASIGREMLGVVLESGAHLRIDFAREIANVTRIGLHTRAASTARVGTRRLLADAFCCGGLLIIAVHLGAQLASGLQIGAAATWSPSLGLLALSFALGLVGYWRLAGAGALAWLAMTWPSVSSGGHAPAAQAVVLAVPLACFATMTIASRQGKPNVRRLAWSTLVLPLAALYVRGGPPNGVVVVVVVGLVIAVGFAFALLPADPRPAIACALLLTSVGLGEESVGLRLGLGSPLGLPLRKRQETT